MTNYRQTRIYLYMIGRQITTLSSHYNKLRDISIEAKRIQNAPQKGAQSGMGFYTHCPFYELISPRIYLDVQKNPILMKIQV